MVRSSGFVWHTTPTSAWEALFDNYLRSIRAGILGIAQRRAPEIQNWMRDNASWTDRTGNARQALHTAVEAMTNEIVIYLAHGVTYGVYLELRNSGRYAIITPALDEWAPVIWQDVKGMIGG
jgi:hypothetical protein